MNSKVKITFPHKCENIAQVSFRFVFEKFNDMLTPDYWHDVFLLSLELFEFFSLSLDVLKFHCDIAQYNSFLIHCHECSVGL